MLLTITMRCERGDVQSFQLALWTSLVTVLSITGGLIGNIVASEVNDWLEKWSIQIQDRALRLCLMADDGRESGVHDQMRSRYEETPGKASKFISASTNLAMAKRALRRARKTRADWVSIVWKTGCVLAFLGLTSYIAMEAADTYALAVRLLQASEALSIIATATYISLGLIVVGMVMSSGLWAVGAFSNNYTQSVVGKQGFIVTAASALGVGIASVVFTYLLSA